MGMRLTPAVALLLTTLIPASCAAQDWQSLWNGYVARFMDNQVRVIDHDAGDRTTSEGEAYGMFFALVANDRSRFDGLLRWTTQNLADGDLSDHLPAWLWGRGPANQWGVLDHNSAADADVWMAYTLLEAGEVWNEPRYTKLGLAVARRIAAEEVVQVPDFGAMIAPGPTGFRHGTAYRFNASYVPLQLILGLEHFTPGGPWSSVATTMPTLIRDSAPDGFASDWIDLKMDGRLQTSNTIGSYDAIRVYLWAGMLDNATPQRSTLLSSLGGMAGYLRNNPVPPAKVGSNGSIEDPKGPVGFSAALLPYASALHNDQIRNEELSRVQSEYKPQTGLIGDPPKYYDENLVLFGLGFEQHEFWFEPRGALGLKWKAG
jgi:endoglucanase